MVKAYVRAGQKFLDSRPDSKTSGRYKDVYEWFVRDVFFDRQSDWDEYKTSLFVPDCKALLETYFGIDLTIK